MCNVNGLGQLLRTLIGAGLIALAWFGPQTSILRFEWINLWSLGWLGIFPLLSGIAAFCPIYAVLGFNHKNNNE